MLVPVLPDAHLCVMKMNVPANAVLFFTNHRVVITTARCIPCVCTLFMLSTCCHPSMRVQVELVRLHATYVTQLRRVGSGHGEMDVGTRGYFLTHGVCENLSLLHRVSQ